MGGAEGGGMRTSRATEPLKANAPDTLSVCVLRGHAHCARQRHRLLACWLTMRAVSDTTDRPTASAWRRCGPWGRIARCAADAAMARGWSQWHDRTRTGSMAGEAGGAFFQKMRHSLPEVCAQDALRHLGIRGQRVFRQRLEGGVVLLALDHPHGTR